MMEKLAQAGEGGGRTPFNYIYHYVQSWGVRSSWEGRYTPPISTLPLYVLCAHYFALNKSNAEFDPYLVALGEHTTRVTSNVSHKLVKQTSLERTGYEPIWWDGPWIFLFRLLPSSVCSPALTLQNNHCKKSILLHNFCNRPIENWQGPNCKTIAATYNVEKRWYLYNIKISLKNSQFWILWTFFYSFLYHHQLYRFIDLSVYRLLASLKYWSLLAAII